MLRRTLLSALFLVGLVVVAGAPNAQADLSPKVIKAFSGQILVSDESLRPADSEKETIAAFKKQRKTEVVGEPNADDVQVWDFHYTAFLKKKGATELALEFHTDGKFVADRRLTGVDPQLTVLEGDISITEDDGPAKGKKYTLKLVATIKGKEVVLATSPLTLK